MAAGLPGCQAGQRTVTILGAWHLFSDRARHFLSTRGGHPRGLRTSAVISSLRSSPSARLAPATRKDLSEAAPGARPDRG